MLITAAAFAGFALVHSLTVSDFFKAAVARLAGEAWMRAYYRLAFTAFSAALTAAAAWIILSQPDTFIYRPPWYVLWPAHGLQLAGVWLLYAAFRPFDAGYFSGIRQAAAGLSGSDNRGDIEGIPKGGLVTTGVYGLVRHPMYLGGIAVFLFEPNVTANCLVLRVLAAAYFVIGGLIEDRRLAARYGDEYGEYRRRVPMFNIFRGFLKRRG